ncbi:hypothetical protein [Priestia sp. YIM B13490]|uniref:hypothetical protein n=1 Tax=Priestia sp. YIM B13490 TaxID=3366310 RepID=UPI00366DA6A8
MPSFFKDPNKKKNRYHDTENQPTDHSVEHIHSSLLANLNIIKLKRGTSSGFVVRQVKRRINAGIKVSIVYALRQSPRLINANTVQEWSNQRSPPPAPPHMVNRDLEAGVNNEA